jgi:hypothetical protein
LTIFGVFLTIFEKMSIFGEMSIFDQFLGYFWGSIFGVKKHPIFGVIFWGHFWGQKTPHFWESIFESIFGVKKHPIFGVIKINQLIKWSILGYF